MRQSARSITRSDLLVVIPAAVSRLKTPRCLVEVQGGTLLRRLIDTVRSVFRCPGVVVTVGEDSGLIQAALPRRVRACFNPDWESTGAAYSAAIAMAGHLGSVLIVHGDMVFARSAIAPLSRARCSSVLVERGKTRRSEVGVNVVNGHAAHFGYGTPGLRWANAVLLDAEDAAAFRGMALDLPSATTHELLNRLMEAGSRFRAVEGEAAEIDLPRDIPAARRFSEEKRVDFSRGQPKLVVERF